MNLASRIFAVPFIFFAAVSAYGQDGIRLLPASFTASIDFKWHQDGRVVDIQVINPKDKWVLQRLVIEVTFEPDPSVKNRQDQVSIEKQRATKLTLAEATDIVLSQESPQNYSVNVEAQPGQSSSAHFELALGRKISSAVLIEVRGREQSRFERVWNLVR